jgi:thiol:disulfide interchange protein DsbC
MLRFLPFLLAFLAAHAAANEAVIRKALEPKVGATIEGIQPAPVPGLFEVRLRTASGPQILYTDAAGTYLIDGSIYHLASGKDLTAERMRKLTAIRFDALPLDQAVKIQRGNGRRVLAMFSDPYCPYCQKFEQTLLKVDDVVVYVFMYPVIRPQNADHSKAVWCSPDRAKAWLELAIQHKRPAASVECDNPVEKNLGLGRFLGINSTPTLILANGERIAGGMSLKDLVEALDEAAKTKK